MKTILTTLNAKYIHTSLALRWLYVVNRDRFDIAYREFVIKEDVSTIVEALLSEEPDVIGVGVYIWNVEKTKQFIELLKLRRPDLIIILGGPEVSFEPEYFVNHSAVDYVVSGEGEFVLGDLLAAIENSDICNRLNIDLPSVSSKSKINKIPAKANIEELVKFRSPYTLKEDDADRKNRMLYFETSRGCPYSCAYCLSSLEKGVRYFPWEYLKENLTALIDGNVRQVKFLDRTFNLNKARTRIIFDFLIEKYRPNLSFQFEIYADLLDDTIINHLNTTLPPGFFRFEIGIQSTYEPTNKAVKRKQDFELLAQNIRKIMDGAKVDLHLDLIAGLPNETFDRFRTSFNEVFALGAKEVQLGFLKMLRGTSLRAQADKYDYRFDDKAPYQIISNAYMSRKELERIHEAEEMLERYWNSGKFSCTMKLVFDKHYVGSYFEFFDELASYSHALQLIKRSYRLEDSFQILHQFLVSKEIDLFDSLRVDYYSCFNVRPQGFWNEKVEKKLRKKLLYHIGNDRRFVESYGLSRRIIEKQAVVDSWDGHICQLVVFCNDGSRENPLYLKYEFLQMMV